MGTSHNFGGTRRGREIWQRVTGIFLNGLTVTCPGLDPNPRRSCDGYLDFIELTRDYTVAQIRRYATRRLPTVLSRNHERGLT